MARVSTTITDVIVDGDYGTIDGIGLTCDRCGHFEQTAGTEDRSKNRCALLLRENCPKGEKNFYVVD